MQRVLLLGGTTEARMLALALAEAGVDGVFSYAGRTAEPVTQALPCRIGGFGGIDGLVRYLAAEAITHVVDATHPFAAQMSRNAVEACSASRLPLVAFERDPWVALPGDRWRHVADLEAAADALPDAPARVFLAIGRQHLGGFAGLPHRYVLRLVDAPADLPLPGAEVVVARGPFDVAGDLALMRRFGVEVLVCKNAGGRGAEAKLIAARELGVEVIMVDRPALPLRASFGSVPEVMQWLGHPADLGV